MDPPSIDLKVLAEDPVDHAERRSAQIFSQKTIDPLSRFIFTDHYFYHTGIYYTTYGYRKQLYEEKIALSADSIEKNRCM